MPIQEKVVFVLYIHNKNVANYVVHNKSNVEVEGQDDSLFITHAEMHTQSNQQSRDAL